MPLKLVRYRQRGPNWYIRGTLRGVHVFETTGVADRTAAETVVARRQSEILDEATTGRKRRRFIEAALIYMETPGRAIGERRYVMPLVDAWGNKWCDEIGQSDMDRFVRDRYQKAKPSTVLRQAITPATAVLNVAARRKWCAEPSFERPAQRALGRRDVWFTQQEAAGIVDAAGLHVGRVILFLCMTGARVSEAVYLDWADVDLASNWAIFRNTKRHGEDRGVPLHPQVVAMLANLRHRQGPVFLTPKGKPYVDRHKLAGGQIKTGWRMALARAGMPHEGGDGRTPHACRHSFSTWLLRAGASEYVKDRIMGHASSAMGRRYSHVAQDDARQAILLLEPLKTGAKSVQDESKAGRNAIKRSRIAG